MEAFGLQFVVIKIYFTRYPSIRLLWIRVVSCGLLGVFFFLWNLWGERNNEVVRWFGWKGSRDVWFLIRFRVSFWALVENESTI